MSELDELTNLFSKLGAREPKEWASSQLLEGINQLGRFLFLRQAWREVIPENDHSWIQAQVDYSVQNPGEPCSGIGQSLQNLLAKGGAIKSVTRS